MFPGGRKQDEAGSSGNGSKKPQKEDRSAEKDGDLLLAGSSAGSARSRHGGSVYDLLVAEIKVGSPDVWHRCEDPGEEVSRPTKPPSVGEVSTGLSCIHAPAKWANTHLCLCP